MNSPLELGFDHRFIPAPDASDASASDASAGSTFTLLLLHGTGGDGDSLLQLGHTLSPAAALLSPTGKVVEGSSRRFFRRRAEGVFDQEDLVLRTRELAQFVRDATLAYNLDPKRVVAIGYSNGANIAASLMLSGESLLAGAVLFRAMVPFEPNKPPQLTDVSVLLCAGERDDIATPAQTERLKQLLVAAGAGVDVHREPGGHELTMADIQAATVWFGREFGAEPRKATP